MHVQNVTGTIAVLAIDSELIFFCLILIVPRLLVGEGEKPTWYAQFVHAFNSWCHKQFDHKTLLMDVAICYMADHE